MLSEKPQQAHSMYAHGSTDSKTESGKAGPVELAARRLHAGHVVVLSSEEMQAFERFTGEIVDGFAPETAIERHLAHLYAAFQWRIQRAAAIEDTMFSLGIVDEVSEKAKVRDPKARIAVNHAMTFRTRAIEFEKISVVSQSLVIQGSEVLGQLKRLQAERKKQDSESLTSAAILYQFHRMQNQIFDPKQNGFDLTIDQIEDHVRRDNLQNEALEAQKSGFDAARYTPRYGRAGA